VNSSTTPLDPHKHVSTIVMVWLVLTSVAGPTNVAGQPSATVIRPGDELLIEIPSHPELSGVFVVDVRGYLVIPPADPCLVGGQNLTLAADSLSLILSEFYQQLSGLKIQVLRHQLAVRVEGRVTEPGDYFLPYYAGVEEALRSAGGIVEGGLLTRVMIQRGDIVHEVDLREYRISGSRDSLPPLQSGDRIFVPVSNRNAPVKAALAPLEIPFEDPNVVHLIGAVPRGGTHQMPGSLTLFEALALGGAPGLGSDIKHIRIIPPDADPFEVNLETYTSSQAPELPIVTAGTTILVPEKRDSFLMKTLTIAAPIILSAFIIEEIQ